MSVFQAQLITGDEYRAARRQKDNIVAETKYGFVLKFGDVLTAYIKDGRDYYSGNLLFIDENEFQSSALGDVTTTTTVELIPPPANDEKSAA